MFIFILNISIQQGLSNGLASVIGVTVVDYIYIILAILGVGKLLEVNRIKKVFSLLSSIVLIIFGVILLVKGIQFNNSEQSNTAEASLWGSFLITFMLTISSPLTILFWTSIFTTKAIELSLSKKELKVFGIAAGMATFMFLGTSVLILSLFRLQVPKIVFKLLNIAVGAVLTVFGITRILKTLKPQ
ncbi:MAG: LysE family transporter [Spirochaetales bacterium]|nr:LysE family transporter [Spirochaetales bacterium]